MALLVNLSLMIKVVGTMPILSESEPDQSTSLWNASGVFSSTALLLLPLMQKEIDSRRRRRQNRPIAYRCHGDSALDWGFNLAVDSDSVRYIEDDNVNRQINIKRGDDRPPQTNPQISQWRDLKSSDAQQHVCHTCTNNNCSVFLSQSLQINT